MDITSTVTNPDNVMMAFTAAVLFFAIVTIVAPMLNSNGLENRMKSVANRREELRKRSREALAQRGPGATSTLRHTDAGLYKTIVDRLQLSRLLEDPKVVDKLVEGMR